MGSVGLRSGQFGSRRDGVRTLAGVALSALLLLVAGNAYAAPYIPFDAQELSDGFSYGYVNPASYGVTTFNQMDDYYQAASSGTPQASSSLLHVDPVSFERCPRSSDGCSSDFHVFDVEWDVTFNADVLPAPGLAYLVDLILVDSDPNPIFDNNLVEIDYASAELDGDQLGFATASLGDGDYYFIDLALGSMLDGETKRVKFTYRVEGTLPLAGGGQVGFLFPVILPGAYLAVPEPGTAGLLGLGLAALATRARRRSN